MQKGKKVAQLLCKSYVTFSSFLLAKASHVTKRSIRVEGSKAGRQTVLI